MMNEEIENLFSIILANQDMLKKGKLILLEQNTQSMNALYERIILPAIQEWLRTAEKCGFKVFLTEKKQRKAVGRTWTLLNPEEKPNADLHVLLSYETGIVHLEACWKFNSYSRTIDEKKEHIFVDFKKEYIDTWLYNFLSRSAVKSFQT